MDRAVDYRQNEFVERFNGNEQVDNFMAVNLGSDESNKKDMPIKLKVLFFK